MDFTRPVPREGVEGVGRERRRAMGIGLGTLVGTVTTTGGQQVPYAAFIAPALLATAAMNGAIYDSTWNVFFKMQFAKLYEGMLSTSLGPLDVALGEIMVSQTSAQFAQSPAHRPIPSPASESAHIMHAWVHAERASMA